MYITQPTISKMIKNLEEELGVVLFERLGKKVELTDAGEAILLQVQNIVHSVQNLSSELDDIRQIQKGHIRIGLPPMVGASFFPKVLGKFHEVYPNIMIQLWEDGAKKVADDVANGSLDIGVALLPIKEELFDWFSFVEDNLMLLLHPSHHLAGQKVIRLAELADEEIILFHENFALHDNIITACIQSGFQPRVSYESSQWDFISEMVAANLGVAFLPSTICREMDKRRVCVLPLIEPVIPWHLAVIWHKHRYLSFAAREWLAFTKQSLGIGNKEHPGKQEFRDS